MSSEKPTPERIVVDFPKTEIADEKTRRSVLRLALMRPDEKDPSWWGPGWGLMPVIVGGVLVFVVGILIGSS
jgi:hypothetical protein